MDNQHTLSDIQLLNLMGLNAFHAAVLRDAVSACYSFHLTLAQLNCLQDLAAVDLAPLVGAFRHVSLFRLRDDFQQLLESPPKLRPLFATLSEPEPTVWTPPVRDRRAAAPAAKRDAA